MSMRIYQKGDMIFDYINDGENLIELLKDNLTYERLHWDEFNTEEGNINLYLESNWIQEEDTDSWKIIKQLEEEEKRKMRDKDYIVKEINKILEDK